MHHAVVRNDAQHANPYRLKTLHLQLGRSGAEGGERGVRAQRRVVDAAAVGRQMAVVQRQDALPQVLRHLQQTP